MLVQAQAYRQQYGFNAIVLFPVNLYGPGDNFDMQTPHVIPALIRKCVEAQAKDEPRVVLWGDGSPSREFLYVDDAARAILMAAEQYNGHEPVNIGTGEEITIQNLAHLIADEVGYKGELVWDTGKPNGQPRRCLDTTRAKQLFGFEAAMKLGRDCAQRSAGFRRIANHSVRSYFDAKHLRRVAVKATIASGEDGWRNAGWGETRPYHVGSESCR